MLRQTEITEQKKSNVLDAKTEIPGELKPGALAEIKLQNPTAANLPQENLTEDFVKKANDRFLEANRCFQDKNYNYAVCQYTNTITNAFLAIENKQKNPDEMFRLIDKSVRFLADFAADNYALYQKCQDDAKIKFALTYHILSKDPMFNQQLPVVNDVEYTDKINSLLKVLRDKRELLISLIENEADTDIATLYTRSMKLTLKELFDNNKKLDENSSNDNKTNTALKANDKISNSKLMLANNSIFKSPIKAGAAFIVPGMFLTSIAYAGLYVAFMGGLSFFAAGALTSLAYNNKDKISECCRKKPKPG